LRDIPGVAFLRLWLRRGTLEPILFRELGPDSLRGEWQDDGSTRLRAFPLGVVGHWPAGNIEIQPVLSLTCALLGGNGCLVRVPGRLVETTQLMMEKLHEIDRGGLLTERIFLASFDHSRTDLHQAMAQAVDGAMIWGGAEAVSQVKALPFPHWARVVVFGPRLSVAAMDAGAWADIDERENWCRRIARDVWQFDQQACSSPQTLFLEHAAGCDPAEFAEDLRRAFQEENRVHPCREIEPALTSAICQARASWLLDDVANRACFPASPDWTILEGNGTDIPKPTQGRTLSVLVADDLREVISRFDGNVQTLGFGIKDSAKEEMLANAAGRHGVDRVVRLGQMHAFGSPWDGVDLVRSMVRFVRHAPSQGLTRPIKTKHSDPFLEALEREAKIFAPAARATFEANRELCSWLLHPLARWAEAAYGSAVFDAAARGYSEYCVGVAKAKQLYERNGRYSPEAMPEIMSGVYEHEGYMIPYMWAAILIYPFWPSMVSHIALFRDEFVRRLPPNANVMELAAGHGVLSLLAAEERPDIRVEGTDISPPAVAVANRLLAVSGHVGRVRFAVKDALQTEDSGSEGTFQGVISGMLAEHLVDPAPLFAAMARRVSRDGLVFFSTALESPQRDHVFEYNQESEPLRMAESAGLRVVRLASDASAVSAGSRFLPRATAMILRPR